MEFFHQILIATSHLALHIPTRNMKTKHYFLTLPLAAAIAVSSCKKSEPAAATPPAAAAGASADSSGSEIPAAIVPTATPSQRAEKLGFARHLPKDAETFLVIQNGEDVVKRFQGSKLYQFIKSQNPEVDDVVAGDDSAPIKPMDILGKEIFIATGKSTGVQTENLVTLSNRQSYYKIRGSMTFLISSFKGEDPDFSEMNEMRTITELLKDQQSGIELLKKSEMPPVYIGCKTTPANREKVLETISGLTANMAAVGAAVEEVSFEVAGTKFSGHQIVGKKLVEEMTADESQMEALKEKLGEDDVTDLTKVVAEKNLLVVTGMVGDYVVLFAGSRKEDLRLASSPEESFASSDVLAFADPYLGKNPVAVAYSDKGVINGVLSSDGISTIASAIRDAIAGNGKVDTREIESLLEVISEREKDLQSLVTASDFGMVALFEEGFKIETFGGSNSVNIQSEITNRMGDVGNGKDAAVFMNWTANPVYGIKLNAYLESIVETTYAVARNVSTWEVEENESFASFQQGFAMFDEKFSGDLLKVWSALSEDMNDGLGHETAIVVDLGGEMPALPDVPQALVKAGKFPRLSMIKPVKDRAKLTTAWEKINSSGESLMKVVSEMQGSDQAFPKPMSSQNNGLTSWWISAPLFTDDFSPSVTLDDKWFVLSSSKKHAAELAQKAQTSNSGMTGAYMIVKFDALRACAEHWLKVVDENQDAVFKENESAKEDFDENKTMVKDALNAFSELEQMTLHTRKESGVERSSFHLKTR
jgi:hypothetical protein